MSNVKLAVESEFDVKDISLPEQHISDEFLVDQVRQGDVNAYGQIMRRHNQRLYRVARSIVRNDADALDVVQEAHIKAYTRINDYHGKGQFPAWLGVITRNEALTFLRKNKQEVAMSDNITYLVDNMTTRDAGLQPAPSPETELENKQLRALLNTNVDRLPDDFRSVFVLRAVEQFSIQETAEILDIKPETVKTRLFRAKRLLRTQIETGIENQVMQVYPVGGVHCDEIVRNVMLRIKNDTPMID